MSILFILGYFLVLILVCILNQGIRGFAIYLDSPMLLYSILFILVTLFFTGTMKDFLSACKIALRKKKTYSLIELKKAEQALHLTIKIALLFGAVSCVIGLIAMLYTMDNPSTIGPSLAAGLYGVLYSLVWALLMTPLKAKIHLLVIAYAEENVTQNTILTEEALEQRIFYLFRSKGLTDREAEIARLVSQELTNREIAGRLYISEATVKKHITHILEKLQLDGREDIIELVK